MERKRDGFVPIGDVVAGGEPPGGLVLTHHAATPQARSHFTQLDQVTQPTRRAIPPCPTTWPPIHPGEILNEAFLSPLRITQYRLAKAIGVDPRRIHAIA